MSNLKVLFCDQWLLALNKPAGLLAVPGRGPDKQVCLSAQVQAQFPGASVVHRLDRDTSGVMLMARDMETHRSLCRQLEQRSVGKTYMAVVFGRLKQDTGSIDAPLTKDFAHPPRHKVDFQIGRSAVTHWRVLKRDDDRTTVHLFPLTGRSHQLRIHMAHLGHWILGDPLYSPPEAAALSERLMLHACQLELEHPATQARLRITAPLPLNFARFAYRVAGVERSEPPEKHSL